VKGLRCEKRPGRPGKVQETGQEWRPEGRSEGAETGKDPLSAR